MSESKPALAAEYGVCDSHIRQIARGAKRYHVPMPEVAA